ncbi:MAG: oligogalacturonate lyase family protein [Acidobacteriota bacterium]
MKDGFPVTRRDFVKKTALASATVSAAPTVLSGAKAAGRKGKIYPDQRRHYRDSKTGRTVWQMTDTPGRVTHAQYFTQPAATPDGRWLVYGSDRGSAPEQLNLFKMDLQTGESMQLTESDRNLTPRWSHISPDGKEVYFIENGNHVRTVNLDTLEERSICRLEGCFRPHQLNVSSDNRFLIDGVFLEDKPEEDFLVGQGFLIRSALVVINIKTGEINRLLDGNTPRTHAQFCPSDPNLILYCYGGPWWRVQRMWLIRADGTGNRPIFVQTNFEGVGHDFWSEDGKTLCATCSGGRQPQGLWAVRADGQEERCALAGPCTGHGTVNAAEDRFVIDEIYNDCTTGLWYSRKGSVQAELLCQTGVNWAGERQEYHPHPKFLPDGRRVSFTSAMSGSGEVYIVEL